MSIETRNNIAATLTRLATHSQDLAAEIGTLESSWFCAADLLAPDSALLNEGLARTAKNYPGIDPRTTGAFFFGHYVWYVAMTAIAAYLSEKRVPDLALENMALRYTSYTWEYNGRSGESQRLDVRFLSTHFAALLDDPAARNSGVMLLRHAPALREWLRMRLEMHLTPIVEQLHYLTHLSRRALWNIAADTCARLFIHTDSLLDNRNHGEAEGLAFVKAPGSAMNNPKTGYVTLEYMGHSETYCTRGGCCRYYMLPGRSEEKCSTCVLRKPAERDERLLKYMAERYAVPAAQG